jgi:hypothetical protein
MVPSGSISTSGFLAALPKMHRFKRTYFHERTTFIGSAAVKVAALLTLPAAVLWRVIERQCEQLCEQLYPSHGPLYGNHCHEQRAFKSIVFLLGFIRV